MKTPFSLCSSFLLFFCILFFVFPSPVLFYGQKKASLPDSKIKRSLVILEITPVYHNMLRPWIQEAKNSFHALALVVPGKKLLALANDVEKAGLIEVSQHSSYEKTLAKVTHIDSAANLALLSVEEGAFFKKLSPLAFGKDAGPGKSLSAVRVDKLFHVSREDLHIKEIQLSSKAGFTDLPIYSFHSSDYFPLGGLLLDQNKLCGFISYSSNNGKGEAILPSILQAFLLRSRKKSTSSKVDLSYYRSSFISQGFRLKSLVDPVKRSYYKLPYKKQGALVNRVLPGTSAWKILQNGDILLSIDGTPIDNLGLYEDRRKGKSWGRQNAQLLLTLKKGKMRKVGEFAKLKVLRKGKEIQLKMKLRNYIGKGERIPSEIYGIPNYFIENGIVFLEMSVPLLNVLYGKKWQGKASQASYLFQTQRYYTKDMRKREKEKKSIVILGHIFPDPSTRGLNNFSGSIVEEIKGENILDLKSLYERILELARSGEPMVKLQLYGGRPLYIDLEKRTEINKRILEKYSIPALSSREWKKKMKR